MRKTIEIFVEDKRTIAKIENKEFNLGEVKKISTEFHPYLSGMIESDKVYFVYADKETLVKANGNMRDLAGLLDKKYYFANFSETEDPSYVLILNGEETININI